MKKKEEESIIRKTVSLAAKSFRRAVLGSNVGKAVEEIKEEVEDTIKLTKKRLDEFADSVATRTLSLLLIVSGIVIGFLGLAYFLIDFAKIDRSVSFMLVGILIILFGWLSSWKKS